jgi:hypothetical protein
LLDQYAQLIVPQHTLYRALEVFFARSLPVGKRIGGSLSHFRHSPSDPDTATVVRIVYDSFKPSPVASVLIQELESCQLQVGACQMRTHSFVPHQFVGQPCGRGAFGLVGMNLYANLLISLISCQAFRICGFHGFGHFSNSSLCVAAYWPLALSGVGGVTFRVTL